jgi:nitrogen fixation protein NifU and related proteins
MRISREEYQQQLEAQLGKTYSDRTVDHALHPRNMRNLPLASGCASITGTCGDTMEIWLSVNNDVIEEAVFMTDGCVTTIAAGSMVTELARGKHVDEALQIDDQQILERLDGLPEESRHCALLAASTLEKAIMDYHEYCMEKQRRCYKKQW